MVAKGKVSKKNKKKSRPESSSPNQKNVEKDQKRAPVVKKSVTPAKKQRNKKIVKETKKSRGGSKSKVNDDSSLPDDEIHDVLEESDVSEEEDDAPTPKKMGKLVNAKKSKTVPAKNDSSEESDESSGEAKKQAGKGSPAKKKDESSDEDSEDETEKAKTQPKGKLFSDQNAAWLKPKKEKSQLLSSDSEEGEDEAAEDSDDDEEMEVERKSRLLDAEMEMEEEEAEEEMRETVAKNTSIYHLPTKEELERDVDRVVPPSEIKSHIENILEVLADFSKRREPGRARTDYVEQLGSFMAELHGYLPELMHYFISMFGPSETVEFVDYSDKTRPMVIRTNTLKTRRKDLALALMKRGVTLDPLASWSKVGLKIIESPVPVGATPEYLSGHYMLQSAASMCPVLALDPQPKERVLDMSAAPGGKTSYLAQLMRNTGVIFANDLRPDRQKATVANMHRLGVKNVVACTHDGRKLGQIFKHYRFDRVLLDAPCSGLGVISRDPSVKVQRTLADVNKCAHLQKELLLAAIDVLNHKSKTSKGTMVYSTCSVSIAENEEVINYALQKRDIKIIDAGLDFGKPGFTKYQQKRFHPSVALTRRFYPHVHNMDGFFVAKIQKLSDKRPGEEAPENPEEEQVTASEKAATEVSDDESPKQRGGAKAKQTAKKNQKGKNDKKRSLQGSQGKGPKDKKRSKPSSQGKEPPRKKAKVAQISVPPTKSKQKSKPLSAKTSKPRRKKSPQDNM